MKQSFKKNVFFNTLLSFANVLFPLVTAPYVSRILGAENLGLCNFATTYVTYFTIFASLGLSTYGVREIAKVKENEVERNAILSELFTLSLISTFIVSLVYILTIVCIPLLQVNVEILLIAGVMLFTVPFNVEWFFMGTEQFDFIAIRSLVIKTLSLIALFIFVKHPYDVSNYVAISMFALVCNQIWNFYILFKRNVKFKLSTKTCLRHIKYIYIFLIANVATSAYNYVDVVMLGFLSDMKNVAYYSNANHIIKMIVSLTSSFAIVGLPRISSLYAECNHEEIQNMIDKALSFISFFVFPVCLSIVFISPTFVTCFFGPDYKDGALTLQILSAVIVLIGFSYIFSSMILVSMGHEKAAVRNTIIGAIINIIINAFFIPRLGAEGASFASVVAELAILILNINSASHSFGFIKFNLIVVLKNLILSTVIVPIYYLTLDLYCGWQLIFVFGIVSILFYILIQLFMKNPIVLGIFNFKTK